ncbi:MAG TPA: hypothetical protein PKE39_10145 [Ignavibacteria bacterium]|nr:hypothetical protein [Ignavibacteria bacterium]HMQ99372.1 hypothetical protein [Ignavibacteria bacterium]
MKKYISVMYIVIVFAALLVILPGCEFIGDVFKAGIWVGIIIIIAIIAVVAFIVKMFKE